MKLLIDDLRNIPADRIARTFDDGIAALKEKGWSVVYIDHDFGDPDPKKTGYDIMSWLEENPEFVPASIVLVSDNPPGRLRMEVVRKRLYGLQGL